MPIKFIYLDFLSKGILPKIGAMEMGYVYLNITRKLWRNTPKKNTKNEISWGHNYREAKGWIWIEPINV